MVHSVKVNGEIFVIPAGCLIDIVQKYLSGGPVNYDGLKEFARSERIDEPGFPIKDFADRYGYVDFDEMQASKAESLVCTGIYKQLLGREIIK